AADAVHEVQSFRPRIRQMVSKTPGEAFGKLRLQRVIVGKAAKLQVIDVGPADEGAQKVRGQRTVSRHGRIDAGGQEVRSIRNGVDVAGVQQVFLHVADIG